MHVALASCRASLCKGANDDDRKDGYEDVHIVRRRQQRIGHRSEYLEHHSHGESFAESNRLAITTSSMSLKVPKANNVQLFKEGYKVRSCARIAAHTDRST